MFFYMKIIIQYCICTLATGLGTCSQELDHYETLVLSVVCFVLKMIKIIDFYIKTRYTRGVRAFFPEQDLVSVTVLQLKKLCKVHMRVLEIVAHRNVDNWT